MNAFAHFPTRLHWTAQQLADAVPLRLHELDVFDAARDAGNAPAANAANASQARRGGAYLRPAALHARFRIL